MCGCGPKEKGWYVGNPIGGRVSGIWGYGRRGGNDLRLGRPLMPLSPPPLLGGLGSRVELTELVFEGAVSLWRGFIVRDPRNERSVSLSASCRSYTSLYNSLSLLKKQIKNTTTHKKKPSNHRGSLLYNQNWYSVQSQSVRTNVSWEFRKTNEIMIIVN